MDDVNLGLFLYFLKANMTMEHQQCADVFPIVHGDFPLSCYIVFGGVDNKT